MTIWRKSLLRGSSLSALGLGTRRTNWAGRKFASEENKSMRSLS
jgi:hypothetical protein